MASVPMLKETVTPAEQRQIVLALEMAAATLDRQSNRLTIKAAADAVKSTAAEFLAIANKLR